MYRTSITSMKKKEYYVAHLLT